MTDTLCLISATAAGVALSIDNTDSKFTSWLPLAISAVSSFIESQCERQFVSRTQVKVYIADGDEDSLILKHTPISSITSIVDSDGYTWIANTDYIVNTVSGVIRFLSPLVANVKYTITYVGGYASQSVIPDDLKIASIRLLGILHRTREDNTWNVNSTSANLDGSISYLQKECPDDVKQTIRRYRFNG